MILKYFDIKNVFKVVFELLLEVKNVWIFVRMIFMYLNLLCLDCGLFEFKVRKLFEDCYIGKNWKFVYLIENF